jgi:hypothetical protein
MAGMACLALVAPAAAQSPQNVRMEVMVSHISNEPGVVDPRADKLDRTLRDQFRYESLKVIRTETLKLGLDEVGTVRLPNGRRLRVRPLQIDSRGVLTAVSLEGSVDADLRIRNGHLVVIGAERYQGGKLVVSLEPHF